VRLPEPIPQPLISLDIEIISPIGQVVRLHDQGGDSENLGIPWATDPIDGNSSNTTPGIGYEYCFVPGNSFPTLAGGSLPGGTFPSGDGPGTYTDSYIPEGTYSSVEPLTGLLGSPLNGDWTIRITDNFALDNGYIFEWGIEFDPAILPPNLSFTPVIVSEIWDADPSIINIAGNIITVQPMTAGTHCYTYRVIDDFGCEYTEEVCIEITEVPTANPIEDIVACDDDDDGFWQFDLTAQDSDILGSLDPGLFTITYHTSEVDAIADNNAILNPMTFTNTSNPETVYFRIENNANNDCFEVGSFNIILNLRPDVELDEAYILCVDTNGTEEIMVPPTIDTGLDIMNYGFIWYLNGNILPVETGSSLTVVQAGNYSVDVIDNTTGCMNTGNTVVNLSAPPIVTGAVISRPFVDANVIEVTATAPGAQEYEYSLDNGPWQETNIFNNVSPGAHVVYARDINGCGIGSGSLTILDYPLFFTPNGDGFNDTWQISGIADQPSAKIYIYDRYGKLLKQLSPTSIGWDGNFNGQPLPTNDYWFTIEYIEPNNGSLSQFKSHFTLKR